MVLRMLTGLRCSATSAAPDARPMLLPKCPTCCALIAISACSSLYVISGCWELEPYSGRLWDTSAPNEEQRTSRGNAYQSLLKVCQPAPVRGSHSLLPREGMAAKAGDRRAPQYHAGVIKAKPEMIEQVEPGFMCCFTWLPCLHLVCTNARLVDPCSATSAAPAAASPCLH